MAIVSGSVLAGGAAAGGTAAKSTTTLATLASAAAIAGTATAAAASIKQGQTQEAAAKFNAQITNEQAERERDVGKREAEDFRRRQRRLLATSRALRAGSGISTEGTPLLVDEATAAEIELGVLNIEAGASARSTRLDQQAALFRGAGSSARLAGFTRAGSTILTAPSNFNFGGSSGGGTRRRFSGVAG